MHVLQADKRLLPPPRTMSRIKRACSAGAIYFKVHVDESTPRQDGKHDRQDKKVQSDWNRDANAGAIKAHS